MYLSKHKSGIYYVYYNSPNGKRGKKSSQTKFKNEALRFLHSFEFQQKQKSNEIPLSKFVFQYLKHSESIHSVNTTRDYKTTFGFFQKFIDNPNLSEITTKQINEYLRERIKSSSIYQGRKDLINLKSAFNYAVRNKFLIENPCTNIRRIKVPEKQPLYFSKMEYNKFLLSIDNEDFKDLVLLAVNTGLRLMELLTLTGEQIDLNKNIITLDNRIHLTKSKRIRTVPLNNRAISVLTKRTNMNRIFQFTSEQSGQLFRKYRTKSFIREELHFHSLRHTFASWLVQKGVPILNVSKLLGHSDIKTTQIYAHVSANELASSVMMLD